MGGDDVANLVGLGIGGLVLTIAVRLFLRQSDTWSSVLEAEIVRLRLTKGDD